MCLGIMDNRELLPNPFAGQTDVGAHAAFKFKKSLALKFEV